MLGYDLSGIRTANMSTYVDMLRHVYDPAGWDTADTAWTFSSPEPSTTSGSNFPTI